MLIKTRGIVLRAIKYSETSIIVDVYTEGRGLRSYIASGVRSPKAKLKAGLLQVMSLLDMVVYERHEKSLNRIKELRAAHAYQSIPFDVRKGAVGLFLAEIARKTIREPEENPDLFDFLFQAFRFLDETPATVANIHLHFLLGLSVFLGFAPTGRWTAEAPFFDLQEGAFAAQPPGHAHYLDETEGQVLSQLLERELADCGAVAISRAQRRALLRHLLDYYRYHIEDFPEIHAHLILEEVLGG